MNNSNHQELDIIATNLERELASRLYKRQFTKLEPFLLIDLRDGRVKTFYIHPTPSGHWEASPFHTKGVLINAQTPADKSEFELAVYHQRGKRWMPASAGQMRELDHSSHQYVTSVLRKLSEETTPESPVEMLQYLFFSIARNDSERYSSVVLLVEDEVQKQLIQLVLAEVTSSSRWQNVSNLTAWQKSVVIPLPETPSDGFAIAWHEQLVEPFEREYLVIYSNSKAVLYRWHDGMFEEKDLTRRNKIDVTTLSGIAIVTDSNRGEKSDKVLMVSGLNELQVHATIRFILYYLYTYASRVQGIQTQLNQLQQKREQLESDVQLLDELFTRFEKLPLETM